MNEHVRVSLIASIAHELNRSYCEILGDLSQPHWTDAPDWQQESAIAGVKVHLNANLTPQQSHEEGCKKKVEDSWVYGPIKDPGKKQHPCLVEYEQLPISQRIKDVLFKSIVEQLSQCSDEELFNTFPACPILQN